VCISFISKPPFFVSSSLFYFDPAQLSLSPFLSSPSLFSRAAQHARPVSPLLACSTPSSPSLSQRQVGSARRTPLPPRARLGLEPESWRHAPPRTPGPARRGCSVALFKAPPRAPRPHRPAAAASCLAVTLVLPRSCRPRRASEHCHTVVPPLPFNAQLPPKLHDMVRTNAGPSFPSTSPSRARNRLPSPPMPRLAVGSPL
jgi:hypothetical protein